MGNRPPWFWLNLLSLDAPLVALIWQDFLAHSYSTPLLLQGRCVLGLTVWAIYIADRLIDVRGPAADTEPPHHRFYREHRPVWIAVLMAVIGADLLVTLLWLRPVVFVHGLVIAGASIGYLAIFTGAGNRWVFVKNIAAAVLFSAGVFVVASANTPGSLISLLPPWAAFTALCAMNLILIDQWKRARPTNRVYLTILLFAPLSGAAGRWYLAISLSSLGLTALALFGNRLTVEARRVLADLALFTPLLFR
jgi:hypothetical protein